jgi:hypothetical protein
MEFELWRLPSANDNNTAASRALANELVSPSRKTLVLKFLHGHLDVGHANGQT